MQSAGSIEKLSGLNMPIETEYYEYLDDQGNPIGKYIQAFEIGHVCPNGESASVVVSAFGSDVGYEVSTHWLEHYEGTPESNGYFLISPSGDRGHGWASSENFEKWFRLVKCVENYDGFHPVDYGPSIIEDIARVKDGAERLFDATENVNAALGLYDNRRVIDKMCRDCRRKAFSDTATKIYLRDRVRKELANLYPYPSTVDWLSELFD